MNRREFLNCLEVELRSLPEDERNQTTRYYSEMISDKMEDGMTEEEAVAELKSPQQIAEEILAADEFRSDVRKSGFTAIDHRQSKAVSQDHPGFGRSILVILLTVVSVLCWITCVAELISAVAMAAGMICSEKTGSAALCIGVGLLLTRVEDIMDSGIYRVQKDNLGNIPIMEIQVDVTTADVEVEYADINSVIIEMGETLTYDFEVERQNTNVRFLWILSAEIPILGISRRKVKMF